MDYISSPQNPRIKDLISLRDKKAARKKEQAFVVEGAREIERALKCDFVCTSLFICNDVIDPAFLKNILMLVEPRSVTEISAAVYEKLAVREDSGGAAAVFKVRERGFADLEQIANPKIVVVENAEKPGNIGAILRTADGAGFDAVICTESGVDPFNPNVIRASIGTVFSVCAFSSTNAEVGDFCKRRNISLYAVTPEAKTLFDKANYAASCAIVLGSEAAGLSDYWRENVDVQKVALPMRGIADSLNLSVCAGILMYHIGSKASLDE